MPAHGLDRGSVPFTFLPAAASGEDPAQVRVTVQALSNAIDGLLKRLTAVTSINSR